MANWLNVNQTIGSIADSATVTGTMTFSSNANRGLVVAGGAHQATIGTVLLNGTTLTLSSRGTTGFNEQISLYYFNAPPSGGQGTIQVKSSGANGVSMVASEINGVAQSGQPIAVGSSVGTTATVLGTLTPGGYDYMIYEAGYSEGTFAASAQAGQTVIKNIQAQSFENAGASWMNTIGTNIGTNSWGLGASQRWANAYLSLQPAGLNIDSIGGSEISSTGSVLTWPHTVSAGANREMVVGIAIQANSGVGSITSLVFAGNSLTRIRRDQVPGTFATEYWKLDSPPSGLGTFFGTSTASPGGIAGRSYSFTGAGVIPDAQNGGTASGSVVRGTITTVADDTYILMAVDKGDVIGTVTTDVFWTVDRDANLTSLDNIVFVHGSIKTPAGLATFLGTNSSASGTNNFAWSMVSVPPPAGAVTVTNNTYLTLLGVGNI